MKKFLMGCAALLMLNLGVAKAAIVPVSFELGSNIFTLQSDQGFSTLANDADWFVFDVTQLSFVDLDLNRQQAEPDLIASLFLGDVTGYDFGTSTINDIQASDIGPLTFVEQQDDTEPDAFGGPYGDPRFSLDLSAGTYSLLVWGYFGGGTGLDVEFVASGQYLEIDPPTISEPASLAILLLGLSGLILRRRVKS